ncbi:MAG: S28 family serine protease [Kofleriaceae bacterium]
MRWLVFAALIGACGDNAARAVDAQVLPDVSSAFLAELQSLPNVHDVTEMPTASGFHYFVLHFTQPVDHDDPTGPTFLQEVSLLHKDTAAPMVVYTDGYWDYYVDNEVELTYLLAGNQISIEHRYFGTSRPENPDWSKLTIAQMAADEHVIVTSLKQLYTGPYVSSGGSKGGMTAIFFRRFYPEDVVATIPYVAPISFGAPDDRYPPYLRAVGDEACRDTVRALAVEMLQNRRAALEALTSAQATTKSYIYNRVALGPAVESAILGFEWSFWQYYGISNCAALPATTATDQALFDLLDQVSPPSSSDDEQIGNFDAYYYQAYFQLGYPADDTDTYLKPYEMYTDADYVNSLPTAQPAYDGAVAMDDIQSWLKTEGTQFAFIYGQWDPWSAGAFDTEGARDTLRMFVSQGTHNSHISSLTDSDQTMVYQRLMAWTGVAVKSAQIAPFVAREPIHEPHVPAAIRRKLRHR